MRNDVFSRVVSLKGIKISSVDEFCKQRSSKLLHLASKFGMLIPTPRITAEILLRKVGRKQILFQGNVVSSDAVATNIVPDEG